MNLYDNPKESSGNVSIDLALCPTVLVPSNGNQWICFKYIEH
jgi:hypothetical protein